MTLEIPADLWKKLTTTVGLVCVRRGGVTNVMSAEWSYFVNKVPLYVAVVLSPRAATRDLIPAAGEFSVTLCSDAQSALADFAGSFSLNEIDKTTSELIRFGEPEVVGSPWVTGGLVALECQLRQTIPFPVHTMYVGEAVAVHLPQEPRLPLVKHGSMYVLGQRAQRTEVAVAAQLIPGNMVLIAATGPSSESDVWEVSLIGPDGETVPLGSHPSADYGDFLVELALPAHLSPERLQGCRVRVTRPGAVAGYAELGSKN